MRTPADRTLIVDAEDNQLLALNAPVLKERKRMFYDGAASGTVILTGNGDLAADPVVAVMGVADPFGPDSQRGDWASALKSVIARMPKRSRGDDVAVEEAVRVAIRRAFNGRKPLVKVLVVRV